MILVRVTCEEDDSRTFAGNAPCSYADIEVDTGRALDLQIYDQLSPQGWTFNGEKQFCPDHNRDLVGLPIVLSRSYIEPIQGLRLRLRANAVEGGDRVHAELLCDKTHYDIENMGNSVWRIKCVNEEWPT